MEPVSLSSIGSVAGIPWSQRSLETQHGVQEATQHAARALGNQRAADAAGVGQTDGEGQVIHDRQPDGRRPWEAPPEKQPNRATQTHPSPAATPQEGVDLRGTQLDLTG